MYWTLVVMTLNGAALPTNLVFDSLDACYQAEEWMAGEQSRIDNERVSRSAASRDAALASRKALGRGICVPHSPTNKVDNLSKPITSTDPGRLHQFAAMDGNNSGPTLEVFIAPILDYDLPKKQVSFKLLLKNPTNRVISIRNPLHNLWLTFHKPDASRLDLPVKEPDPPRADTISMRSPTTSFMDAEGEKILKGPSNVEFRSVVLNGKKGTTERNSYRIEPKSSLEITVECEPVVGEMITEALKGYDEKHVDVSAHLLLLNAGYGMKTLRLYDKVRIQVPKPAKPN